MATQIDIYNGAAIHLGKDPLFTDIAKAPTQNPTGQALHAAWPIVLEASLRRHYWGCARGRQKVAAAELVPAFGWTTSYELPSDCLRAWDVNFQPGVQREPFAREGDYLLANTTGPINLRYIKRVLDVPKLDAELIEYLTLRLAAFVALKVTGSAQLKERLEEEASTKLREARTHDAQEGDAAEDDEPGDLLSYRARFA